MRRPLDSAAVASVFAFAWAFSSPAVLPALDPAFVARTDALNPTIGGCGIFAPLVAMYPDATGVVGYRLANTGAYTRPFAANGITQVDHQGGSAALTRDLALLSGNRFVIAVDRTTSSQLMFQVYTPPAYPPSVDYAAVPTRLPAVDAGPLADRAVTAWVADPPEARAILAAVFDAIPAQIGTTITVAPLTGSASAVEVLRHDDGSFVVFWEEDYGPPTGGKIWLRRYDAAGAPLGVATPAFETDTLGALYPAAARATDGAAALVYTSPATAAIEARLLQNGGLAAPFTVWSQAAQPATRAKAAFLGNGELVVAAEIHPNAGQGTIQLFRFGRDGQPIGKPVVVAWPGLAYRSFTDPQIDTAGDRVVVVYQVNDNGVDCQIRLRLFDATLFADGFESGDLAAWGGL